MGAKRLSALTERMGKLEADKLTRYPTTLLEVRPVRIETLALENKGEMLLT